MTTFMQAYPHLWTRSEAAESLRTTVETVDALHDSGRLQGVRLLPDEPVRFRPEAVLDFVIGAEDARRTASDFYRELADAIDPPKPPMEIVPEASPSEPTPPEPPILIGNLAQEALALKLLCEDDEAMDLLAEVGDLQTDHQAYKAFEFLFDVAVNDIATFRGCTRDDVLRDYTIEIAATMSELDAKAAGRG